MGPVLRMNWGQFFVYQALLGEDDIQVIARLWLQLANQEVDRSSGSRGVRDQDLVVSVSTSPQRVVLNQHGTYLLVSTGWRHYIRLEVELSR